MRRTPILDVKPVLAAGEGVISVAPMFVMQGFSAGRR